MRSLIALVVLVAVSSGCGLNVQMHYVKMRPNLVSRNFDAANEYLDRTKKTFYKSEKNRLLFYMDKAMVLHHAGRYQESNDFLERAKVAADELWTESVGEHISAVLSNDNALAYEGEDFERVLLHVVGALNYMSLGQFESAQVEARQVTSKLELYNARYEGEARNRYRDDAFARWLSGKLAETDEGQEALNSAWIDYKKALQVYSEDYAVRYATGTPRLVVKDALRVLDALGADFSEELEALKSRYPGTEYLSQEHRQKRGELVLIHLNGEAPFKVDEFWDARAGNEFIRVAYPRFVEKQPVVVAARLVIEELGLRVETELFEDISSIAIENLEDHIGRIRAKAVARAVAKYLASTAVSAVGESEGQKALEILGSMMTVASILSEEADKRSWITLPAEIGVARSFVAPGTYSVNLEFLDRSGYVVEAFARSVVVEAGKTIFLSERTFH